MEQKITQNEHIVCRTYDSPCGRLILGSTDDALCLCDWDIPQRRALTGRRLRDAFGAEISDGQSDINERAAVMLDEYFAGRRQSFDIPLAFRGSELRCKVWEALRTIPYGTTVSYSDVASMVGRPDAVRAVASAVAANPLSIFIPCHRVISRSGRIGDYAGTTAAKIHLLTLEKQSKQCVLFVGTSLRDA